jgi:hypothetical protein
MDLLLVTVLLVPFLLPLVRHARSSKTLDTQLPELERTLAMLLLEHLLPRAIWP